MWFSLFSVVLVLAITFYQGLLGLFTGIINCLLTMLSAALAFGLYQDLYLAFLVTRQPDHGQAIVFVGIFVIVLLILRTLVDLVITGNQHYPVYIDRLGGGIFGFITAQIIVGMLAIGIQMLPFPSTFLGFSRYVLVDPETEEPLSLAPKNEKETTETVMASLDFSQIKQSRQSLWLNPDGFTVNLISHLSNTALTGRNRFADTYPDFLGYCHRARFNPLGQDRQAVLPDTLSVEAYWTPKRNTLYQREPVNRSSGKFFKLTPLRESRPEVGFKRLVVRVALKKEAAGDNRCFSFTTDQVRLVGKPRKAAKATEYFPIGISDEKYPNRYVQLYRGQGIVRPLLSKNQFDFVFDVEEECEPLFIEYKQNARADLLPNQDKTDKAPKAIKLPEDKSKKKEAKGGGTQPPRKPKKASKPKRKTGGRVHGLNVADAQPFFGKELPFEISNYAGSNIVLSGGELGGGRFIADLDNKWNPIPGNNPPIHTLQVPKNQRLLHLFVDKLQPGSWLGGILGRATDKVRNIYLIDDRGEQYMPVGSYALATVNNKKTFELFYLDETSRGFARLPDFDKIRPENLKGKYSYVFLFQIPPGTRPVEFNTGRKQLDLKEFNLIAPR